MAGRSVGAFYRFARGKGYGGLKRGAVEHKGVKPALDDGRSHIPPPL